MKFIFPVFALFLFCKLCIAEEGYRTWISLNGNTFEARLVELVGDSVKIENTLGREFVMPLNKLSKADQEYAIEVSSKNLFSSPKPFDDRGNGGGGIIIISLKGEVTVTIPPRNSKLQIVKPVGRDAIVGESIPVGSTIKTGSDSEAILLLTNGTL